uniref:Acid phosphatase n=1 Tax=Parastrongyloides trichosuri TaxID=131310 RepID=A0A0N5A2Y8_PARTI
MKSSASNKFFAICTKIWSFIPYDYVKGFGVVLFILIPVSLFTHFLDPAHWIFRSLTIREGIDLLKYSLSHNDTCFFESNKKEDTLFDENIGIDYTKDIHIIILDGLKLSSDYMNYEKGRYKHVFSRYHTIGTDKNKRLQNFLNGKLNDHCVDENDTSLITNIFKQKGYIVETYIDNVFDGAIFCSNSNNKINNILITEKVVKKREINSKPKFSLSILAESVKDMGTRNIEAVIDKIVNYQDSNFENSYVVLIRNNRVMYYNPYLMISLPTDKRTERFEKMLAYNHNRPITSNDLYKSLTSKNINFINIFTTSVPERSCNQMGVSIENCRCQSSFMHLPKQMNKLISLLKKRFKKDLLYYFDRNTNDCIKAIEETINRTDIQYSYVSPEKGIHFKLALLINDKRKVVAYYNDYFVMLSKGIISIGDDKSC